MRGFGNAKAPSSPREDFDPKGLNEKHGKLGIHGKQ
jgi:hypothetical protein